MVCAVCDVPIDKRGGPLDRWYHADNFAVGTWPHEARPKKEQPACRICEVPVDGERRCAICNASFCEKHEHTHLGISAIE